MTTRDRLPNQLVVNRTNFAAPALSHSAYFYIHRRIGEIGGGIGEDKKTLDAARSFRPMNKSEVAAVLAKSAQAAADGRYEPYKTIHRFDAMY